MSSFPILDLVLGMFFIYFLLSTISNSAIEVIMTYSHARSKVLQRWVLQIFNDNRPLAEDIMNHPAVTALSAKNKTPSYINASNFYTALFDLISHPKNHKKDAEGKEIEVKGPMNTPQDLTELEENIKNTSALHEQTRSMFLHFVMEARNSFAVVADKEDNELSEIDFFRKKVEDWYNSTQERLTGVIKKRHAIPYTIIIAIGITLASNADSVLIAKYLYKNPEVSAKLAQDAIKALDDTAYRASANGNADEAMRKVVYTQASDAFKQMKTGLPLGWKSEDLDEVFSLDCYRAMAVIQPRLPGWILTIFAIMLGAPFWFDLMNKVANIRGAGAKPETSTTKK